MRAVIRSLSYLQVDPVSVVAPSHQIVLWSRLGPGAGPHFDALLWDERWLFEYWTHATAIVLTEDYPLYRVAMNYWPAPSLKEGHLALAWQDDLVSYLREIGRTPPEVLSEPQLLASLLPTLRADLTMVDTFHFRPSTPLDMPIHAFADIDDIEGSPERMSGWRFETCGRFDLDVIDGGHFFDAASERQVIKTVADDLLA